jgi:hypothetical protein
MCIRCRGNVFTYSNGRLFMLIKNLLTLFRCLFLGRCLEPNVVSEPFASNGSFSGSTVLLLSKYVKILGNPKVHFRINTSPPPVSILSYMNSIHIPVLFL